ncbi:MAG: thermonuclease family protein [Pseudomonadota bacterium]
MARTSSRSSSKGRLRGRPLWLTLLAVAALAVSQWLEGGGWSFLGGTSNGLVAEGRPRLVDGDSLFIGSREVRLVGIDAPEGPQICQRGGRDWRCGDASRSQLAKLINGRAITCEGEKEDRHGRLLAICSVGGRNLNQEMVAQGYALAYGRYGSDERAAKSGKRGLWASNVVFQTPRAWRRSNGIGQ